jgi:hypothetical protein
MSDVHPLARSEVTDRVGIWIQELHTGGWLRGTQPLLRIDNGDQAKRAPFQLDAATGRLHRGDCRGIPQGSVSALYGVWKISKDEQILACPRCKPMPKTDDKKEDPDFPTDLLYGLLSIVNQFGGVLRERGQEYRKSRAGQMLGAQIEHIYRNVNEREKSILDVMLASIDELANTILELHADLDGTNGGDTNGAGMEPPRANGHSQKANGNDGNDVKKDHNGKARRGSKTEQGKSLANE